MPDNILRINKKVILSNLVRKVYLTFIIAILIAFYIEGQNLSDSTVSLKVVNMPLREVLHILELNLYGLTIDTKIKFCR